MEDEILTGRKINEAKNNASDKAVEELLKSVEEQVKNEDRARREKEREEALRKKAEQNRIEQQKREQERKEAAKKKAEQEARAAQEKSERERFVKEQAEKQRVGKELEALNKAALADAKRSQAKASQPGSGAYSVGGTQSGKTAANSIVQSAVPEKRTDNTPSGNTSNNTSANTMAKDPEKVSGNGQRIDILVNDNTSVKKVEGKAASAGAKQMLVELNDDVLVDNNVPVPIRKEGITAGDVIGGFFEFIWTVFKLAVVISIVTAIVGFFLSRELLIRGRNGSLKCLDKIPVSQVVQTNKDTEKADVKQWRRDSKPKKLTMESDDGYIFVAREVVINKDNNNWAVILHGYNGSMEDIYDIARHYTKAGYNVLMPDLRASGESEGSFIGMGWLDRLDVINWIDVILEDNPSANIVVHGVDMGADAGLMLSGEPIKSNIKAIVADGAYTSAWDVMKEEFKERHEDWPVFPLMEMINPVAKIWGGYSLREADAVKQVAKTSVPILLIQGGNDTYVTKEMADELNGAVASSHKSVTIPTATHGDCRYIDSKAYYNAVFDFLDLHVR